MFHVTATKNSYIAPKSIYFKSNKVQFTQKYSVYEQQKKNKLNERTYLQQKIFHHKSMFIQKMKKKLSEKQFIEEY